MSAMARTRFRRGACPGLSAPMQTGDGLLARLMPVGTIGLDQMTGLCAAARQHGNGIVEITSRGSIQARGLEDMSAFADAVAQLGIAAQDGVPVVCNPLAGLDPAEMIDAHNLAAEICEALAATRLHERLSPKVSVAVDGGGALHLDALTADIRLGAVSSPDGPRLDVALGGDAMTATPLDIIAEADAIGTVGRLLDTIAAQGAAARARDALRRDGIHRVSPAPRPAAEPIGLHRLRGDKVAIGVGFPFGHADATVLDELVRAAHDAGAAGFRASPGRALLTVGIAPSHASAFAASAERLGFIVDASDPRRRVVACAGAPICASGEIAARGLGPEIAQKVAPLLDVDDIVHLSGCPKGCAHHGPAALTVVGRAGACDLLVDGAAAGSIDVDRLPQRLAALAGARHRSARHG
jgi:precorrin-3B synthase